MYKLFILFAITAAGHFAQGMELLSKKLPIVLQVSFFAEKNNLEIMLQEELTTKKFSIISKSDMESLITSAAKKAVERNASQIDRGTDMTAFVMNVANSVEPLAQILTVTIVTDKQGNLDSCYLEIVKTPSPIPKKRIVKPRLYIADSTVKKNDLKILAKEIIVVSTGIKESLE